MSASVNEREEHAPAERDALAKVISGRINFDDGAHHLSMGDDGEPCRACQDVADAVLAAGYSKSRSPAEVPPADWRTDEKVKRARQDVIDMIEQQDLPDRDERNGGVDALIAAVWRSAQQ